MVTICDVGPRDGLQNESVILPLQQRAELAGRLLAAGVATIEVGSFVNPRVVPAMAGTDAVATRIDPAHGPRMAALVLNLRGYEALAQSAISQARFAFTATETFNERNQRCSVEASVQAATTMVRRAHADGRRASVTIGAAFGCPYEGPVSAARVRWLAEEIAESGPDELVLADTIGVAVPSQVTSLVSAMSDLGPELGVHLHNTRNTGYANAWAALEAGVRRFDASVGGAGGCPFAPGAAGNIATEDLVYLLEREGVRTGVDIDALTETATWLEGLLGRTLDGRVHRAPAWWPTAGASPGATAAASPGAGGGR